MKMDVQMKHIFILKIVSHEDSFDTEANQNWEIGYSKTYKSSLEYVFSCLC